MLLDPEIEILDQNDSYSFFMVKTNNNRGSRNLVEDVILQQKTAVSMKKLHEIYKLNPDNTRYCHKLCDLGMFHTQCSRVPKHYGEWLDGNRWNCLGWWCSSRQLAELEILIDEHFDEGSMELKLDLQWLWSWKYWWLNLQFNLVYMLYLLVTKNMKNNSWKLRKCFATLNSLKSFFEIGGSVIEKPLAATRK